jgi:hypothetical protein
MERVGGSLRTQLVDMNSLQALEHFHVIGSPV